MNFIKITDYRRLRITLRVITVAGTRTQYENHTKKKQILNEMVYGSIDNARILLSYKKKIPLRVQNDQLIEFV